FLENAKSNTDNRIRKRRQGDNCFYEHIMTEYPRSLNRKQYLGDGVERRLQITAREYLVLFQTRDKYRTTLKKFRQCFIWQGQYMIIDTFLNVKGGFSVLYLDPNCKVEEMKFPESFQIDREVTNVKEYTSYEVSKLKPHPFRFKSRDSFAQTG